MAAEERPVTDEQRLRDCAQLLRTDAVAAAAQLRQILEADPLDADAYRLLAAANKALAETGPAAGEVRSVGVSGGQMRLMQAAQALQADDLPTAEVILRPWLRDKPGDVNALRLMADFAARLGRQTEAAKLLRLVLEIAPAFTAAKLGLAAILYRQGHPEEAIAVLDEVLRDEGDVPTAKSLKAAALGRAGRFDEAIALYEDMLRNSPGEAQLWTSYGHLLKTIGRSDDGIAAFRRAVEIAPSLGEVWWSLSDLKTVRFDLADVARMQAALELDELSDEDRFHFHFALGKSFEDLKDAKSAFAHYAQGNRLRRAQIDYDPDDLTSYVDGATRTFTSAYFAERCGQGCGASDPIFILGMPRAGSTLIEQILSSHREVEGTMELPDVSAMVKRLARGKLDYIDALSQLLPEQLAALGQEYLDRTRSHRKTDRPLFIDKMPNNWLHVPLIHLMLPNARIIDARRHPLACCFSNFKQHFARGQAFSYDLTELGRFYADYVRMMAHIDTVLPGRVYRLFHENLVDDSETEIRRLLDHLQLPFDPACLRFYDNDRAVRTASSQQVRRPINRQGVDQWRSFEQWLGPLKKALGPVLPCYPQPPS